MNYRTVNIFLEIPHEVSSTLAVHPLLGSAVLPYGGSTSGATITVSLAPSTDGNIVAGGLKGWGCPFHIVFSTSYVSVIYLPSPQYPRKKDPEYGPILAESRVSWKGDMVHPIENPFKFCDIPRINSACPLNPDEKHWKTESHMKKPTVFKKPPFLWRPFSVELYIYTLWLWLT